MAPSERRFTDPVNNPFKSTAQVMEEKIAAAREKYGFDRKEAARWILAGKEGWYTQTPEGEFLELIVFEKAGV